MMWTVVHVECMKRAVPEKQPHPRPKLKNGCVNTPIQLAVNAKEGLILKPHNCLWRWLANNPMRLSLYVNVLTSFLALIMKIVCPTCCAKRLLGSQPLLTNGFSYNSSSFSTLTCVRRVSISKNWLFIGGTAVRTHPVFFAKSTF